MPVFGPQISSYHSLHLTRFSGMMNAVKIPETWHFFFHIRREGLLKMLPFEEGFMTHHIETKNDISNSVKKFCCPVENYRIQYIIFETFVCEEI